MTKKNRIAFIGNPNTIHLIRYIRDFVSRGYEIFLLGDHPISKSPPENCTYYDLTRFTNIRKIRYLIWPLIIKKLIKKIQPDIVHAIGIASAGWLAASSNFHPTVVTATGSDLMLLEQRGYLHRFLSQLTIKKADRVICVSKPLYERALKLGADTSKTSIIFIGVDTSIFHPSDQKTARNCLGLDEGNLVLSIRAMSPIYRPLDLAKAIPLVLDSLPQTRFAVFTYNCDPDTFDAFKKIVNRSRVNHTVKYIESIPDDHTIALYYQSANLAVSIPASDGTPSSVLEAMACGLPVIATDLPPLQEWITPDKNGILIKVGDIEALSKAIINILDNSSYGETLGYQASQDVRQRGERSKCLDQIEQVYRSL